MSKIEFLNVPWNATLAEAKRVMVRPEGTNTKEETPDRIVLTGGTFETHAVERWELEFPDGHFRRGTVYVVIPYGKSKDGSLLRNKQYDDYLKRLTDKYGKGTGFGDGKHSQTTWEMTVADPRSGQKDIVSILLSYSWEPYVFKIEYSRRAQTSAQPSPAAAAQPVAVASTPGDPISRDLVKTYRNSLVFVTGADGSGSGFVAMTGGANFLFTNAHVAAGIRGAGFKTLDGTAVQVGAPSIAVGHDIFRMQLGPGGKPMEIMLGVDENVTIDDEVVVLGNAEGAGVINTIKGKIVGIGPNLVEVDAPFQPGNSGSPIIHLKTGKVIGVATYLSIKKYDQATKEVLKTPVVRRFGYRLDSVKVWQPVNWPAFYAQAAEMERVETLTGDLDNFLIDLAKDSRVTTGAHTNPAIKTQIDRWQGDSKRRQSPRDAAAVDQNFIAFLKVVCRTDLTATQPRLTYDYFQRQLAEQSRDRGFIADIFDKIIKEIQKAR